MTKKSVIFSAVCAFVAAPLLCHANNTVSPNEIQIDYTGTATISSSGDCKFSKKISNAKYVWSTAHQKELLIDSNYEIILGFERNEVPLINKYLNTPKKNSSKYKSTNTIDNSTIQYLRENANCNFSHDWGNPVKLFSIPDQIVSQRTTSSTPKKHTENFTLKAAGTINSFKEWRLTKNGSELINGKSTVKIHFSSKIANDIPIAP